MDASYLRSTAHLSPHALAIRLTTTSVIYVIITVVAVGAIFYVFGLHRVSQACGDGCARDLPTLWGEETSSFAEKSRLASDHKTK